MTIGKAVKEIKAGKVEFRVDKTGIIHAPIGKVSSFQNRSLSTTLRRFSSSVMKAKPAAAKGKYLRSLTVSSTMGPGVKVRSRDVAADGVGGMTVIESRKKSSSSSSYSVTV